MNSFSFLDLVEVAGRGRKKFRGVVLAAGQGPLGELVWIQFKTRDRVCHESRVMPLLKHRVLSK